MKRTLIFVLTMTLAASVLAENYLIRGGQESQISYRLVQHVVPASQTQSLVLSYVIPETFESPTFNQRVENLNLRFNPEPSKRREDRDKRGNRIVEATWKEPESPVDVSLTFTAVNRTRLDVLRSQAPFPLSKIGLDMTDYLKATKQVQCSDPRIVAKAKELTSGVQTEFDAVQRILSWIVDHMRYVTPPEQYDALYSFDSGKGNCQNYSHLSAALMRPVGIPVRIVNGVTLKEPYTVKTDEGEFTFKMGQGRHSWIEIWFPDLGWVPFDPQQTELFVSNRFIRIEVGVDNEETSNDGTVRWQQSRGASGQPEFSETVEAEFPADRVNLTLQKLAYGPQGMLLCPEMQASFKQVVVAPPPPPKAIPRDKLDKFTYKKPFLFGNLDYPRKTDFAFTMGPATTGGGGKFEMRKNFTVETAEYATTKLTQYAQVFVLKQPLKMLKAGLALHKFGGNGQIWLDLMADDGGKPGAVIAASELMSVDEIKTPTGYDWVDFAFKSSPVLSPGRYWIGFGFTGSPIINWYYTYGKPVGPIDGTRYKGVYDEAWSGALAFEFNYRVAGWTVE